MGENSKVRRYKSVSKDTRNRVPVTEYKKWVEVKFFLKIGGNRFIMEDEIK